MALEEQLFEAQLQRDEAIQRCTRLQGRLEELFGVTQLEERDRSTLRKAGSLGSSCARENELMATIESLQRALERKQREAEHLVPSSRHMQVSSLFLNGCLALLVSAMVESFQPHFRQLTDVWMFEDRDNNRTPFARHLFLFYFAGCDVWHRM